MKYCIVEDGITTNIILCDDAETAGKLGAVTYYDGAQIGKKYDPYNYYALQELRQMVADQEELINVLTGDVSE